MIKERDVLKHLTNAKMAWDPEKKEWIDEHCRSFIMNIYTAFHDEANVYLELEYIKGCSLLSQIIAKNDVV